jgi:alkanesulfonate monooxygenase SsuD/methylene tetrahydromethanopterin reductase-like flavin-dependent oxidoreductase (luciferase family)
MARAARFGDVWIPYLYTPDQLRSSVETVRTHAGKLGRSPDDIDVGIFVFIHVAGAHAKDTAKRLLSTLYGSDMRTLADRYVVAGPPDACVAQLYEFWLAGARRFIFSTLAESAEEHLQMWAALSQDIVPPFRSLCAAGGGT